MKNFVVGNWKMNQNLKDVENFLEVINEKEKDFNCEYWVAPQAHHIDKILRSSNIKVGAQNCSSFDKGAYTGELSANSLKDSGVSFVIIGHSERRHIFKETSQELKEKTNQALKAGLKVIFCIGETEKEREAGQNFSVVADQISSSLNEIEPSLVSSLIIAYEPVWAIGTGKTATAEQAQEMHHFIREQLAEIFSAQGKQIPLLYGGSVKPNNIGELLSQKDINGALVGGASLKGEDYSQLCLIASKS